MTKTEAVQVNLIYLIFKLITVPLKFKIHITGILRIVFDKIQDLIATSLYKSWIRFMIKPICLKNWHKCFHPFTRYPPNCATRNRNTFTTEFFDDFTSILFIENNKRFKAGH